MSKHSTEMAMNAEVATLPRVTAEYEDTPCEDEKLKNHALQQLGRVSLEGLSFARAGEYHPHSWVEEGLKESIIGQDDAIQAVVTALNRAELRNPNRPYASMMFLGPTGTGKTQLSKELAKLLHGDDTAYMKIDCAEFSHGHEVASLIGAPPGYIGHGQGAALDSPVFKKKKSVLVFDEIEKGALELHDLMLEILEEGEVTLKTENKKISFRDTIIIMTTNVGAREMMGTLDPNKTGFQSGHATDKKANKHEITTATLSGLRDRFRPEFLNRVDNKVVFMPLDDEQCGQALDVYANTANERYAKSVGINLVMTPELRSELVTSTDERHQFGVRPIQRKYESMVESKLAQYITMGAIPKGSRVYALTGRESADPTTVNNDDVVFCYEHDKQLYEKYLSSKIVVLPQEPTVEVPFIAQAATDPISSDDQPKQDE